MRKWFAGMVLAGGSLAFGADIRVVDEIIAKVNGDIITRSDLEKARRDMEAGLRQQQGVTPAQIQNALRERQKDTLRERIDQILLVSRGKELNITVDTEVTKYLAELQVGSKESDPEKFKDLVRQQTGMTYEDYRSQIRDSMITQRVIGQEVASRINIPRNELQAYYDEHKAEFVRQEQVFLREIFLSTDGKTAAEKALVAKKGADLVARGRKGEKYAELARDNSDAVTAKQGGDLPGFKKGELDPAIEKLVWEQPKGYVTEPLSRGNGLLILKVEEHTKPGQATFEEAEAEIRDRLYRPRMEPAVRTYLTKLRENAFLEIREGFQDTGAAPNKDTRWRDPAQLKPETVTKEEVANQPRRRRFLGMVPIPGTSTTPNKTTADAAPRPGERGTSSSAPLKP